MSKVKTNKPAKWQLERSMNDVWGLHSTHVSCDAAKTRARAITGWYSNPQWRILTPTGEVYVIGRKQNGKMRWVFAETQPFDRFQEFDRKKLDELDEAIARREGKSSG